MTKENRLDVDKKQLNILKAIIKQHIPDKSVWVYGSRVTWKASATSDLDLAIFACTDSQIFELKEALEESDLLFSVDVMNWEEIPENFRENIKKQYVVLQAKRKLEGWREVKLGDVGKLARGKSKHRPRWAWHLFGGKYPFIQTGQIKSANKYMKTYEQTYSEAGLAQSKLWEKNTLCITIAANIAEIAILEFPACFPDSVLGFIANDQKCDLDFIYYNFTTVQAKLRQLAIGSVQDNINLGTFENLQFILPPLPEQKTIAEVLSSLDDKIDLLHRQNKTLEDMAQTLFRKWFIDEADDDWESGKIPDEFGFTMGQSPPGKSYNEEQNGTPMFQGNADFGFRFPKNRIYTTQPKRFAEKYDTLISVRAPVGEQNMAKGKCCIGRGVAAFRYKNNNSFYTYTYFKIMSLLKEIRQYNHTGTVFGSISKRDFQSMEIMIPPINLIEKFQETAKPIDDKIISNQSQINTLENLRDTLLPKLMSGEINVKSRRDDTFVAK